jgi:hypothetical protein
MALPQPKKQKKTNVANTKDSNGRAERPVKEQYRGRVSKGDNDTASTKVHNKFGTTGRGPKKTPKFKKD